MVGVLIIMCGIIFVNMCKGVFFYKLILIEVSDMVYNLDCCFIELNC